MGLKSFALGIFSVFVRAVYSVFRLVRRRSDRVVFLSRQQNTPSANFVLLINELHRLDPELKHEFSCRLGLKSEMGLSYIPLLIRQLWMLAGARACVTESYCPPVSIPKSHGYTKIVQIWHSPVAIKRFGWQTVGLPEGSDRVTAEKMRMHAGYDAVICGSDYQRRFFADAMNTDIDKIHAIGLPVTDALTRKNADSFSAFREELLGAYPQARGKRLVAYVPTMRRGHAVPWERLEQALPDGCFLMIGVHPLDSHTEKRDTDRAVFAKSCFSSRQLILGCDAAVSDYSGASVDAAICGKDLFFFVPDIDQYSAECGLNIDPREVFPDITAQTAEEMARLLTAHYPEGARARTRELLAGGCDGHSTENIARLILSR